MKRKYHKKTALRKFDFYKLLFIILLLFILPLVFWASQYPQLIFSLGKTPASYLKPLQTSSLSQSKLGVFYIGATAGGEKIIRAGPRVIKVMDFHLIPSLLELIRLYKRLYPQGTVVWRVYNTENYSLNDSPQESADRLFRNVLQPAISSLSAEDRKLIDYLAGTNGPEQTPYVNTPEGAKWFNSYWVKLAGLISNAGFRPNMGEIYVGNLEVENIEYIIPALQTLKRLGGSWSYHGYTLQISKDENVEIFYSLRYRQFYDYLRKNHPELADIPMILGEGGIDKDGDPQTSGWKARVDAGTYEDWLTWYDGELKKDPEILGVAIFQIGGGGWPSFELEPISSWLADYLGGQPGQNVPTLPPVATSVPAVSPTSASQIKPPTARPTASPTAIPTQPPKPISSPPPAIILISATPVPSPTPWPSPTATPTPSFFAQVKSNWNNFMVSFLKLTKTILP